MSINQLINYSDKEKDTVYSHPDFLPTSDGSIMSEAEFPSLAAFVCIMERKKNKCAPGPNCCLPYLVWKRVPIFVEALYKVFEMIFTKKLRAKSSQSVTSHLFENDERSSGNTQGLVETTNVVR